MLVWNVSEFVRKLKYSYHILSVVVVTFIFCSVLFVFFCCNEVHQHLICWFSFHINSFTTTPSSKRNPCTQLQLSYGTSAKLAVAAFSSAKLAMERILCGHKGRAKLGTKRTQNLAFWNYKVEGCLHWSGTH